MAAAVTVATGWPRNNVNGRFREYYYKFDTAADADWLDVPLKVVKSVQIVDDSIQAIGVASITLQTNGQSRIVLNSAGAMTGCYATVTGW